jgi:hypothetical protein
MNLADLPMVALAQHILPSSPELIAELRLIDLADPKTVQILQSIKTRLPQDAALGDLVLLESLIPSIQEQDRQFMACADAAAAKIKARGVPDDSVRRRLEDHQ